MRIPEPFFVIINPIVRFLLRSPAHGLLSKSVMLITVTGRKTGKRYAIPVRYLRNEGGIWAFTSLETKWWKNLIGGAPVSLRVEGKDASYRAEATVNAPDQVRGALRTFLSRFPQDAPYHDVALGADGSLSEQDLEKAAVKTVWVKAYSQ